MGSAKVSDKFYDPKLTFLEEKRFINIKVHSKDYFLIDFMSQETY